MMLANPRARRGDCDPHPTGIQSKTVPPPFAEYPRASGTGPHALRRELSALRVPGPDSPLVLARDRATRRERPQRGPPYTPDLGRRGPGLDPGPRTRAR